MFDHPEISYHFIGVDIEKLSKYQTYYLIKHIGGPDLYRGASVELVHKDMGITLFQFQEIAEAFKNVFLAKGVSREDVEIIMNFIASHQGQIVTRKSSAIDQIMIPFYRFIRRNFRKILGKDHSWVRSGRKK
jgi:hemoglobin